MISAGKSFKVGLTGGLAAGKSTVAKRMTRAGLRVVDADELVAGLYEPDQPGAAAVRKIFGDSLLSQDGRVDRVLLAEKIFADREARRELEAVIHPLVRSRFEAIAESVSGIVVLEATLLVEAGLASLFDLVVTVEAEAEIRLRRAVDRGLSPDAAKARLSAQATPEQRMASADVVIWNNGDISELHARVDQLVENLRKQVHEPH
ncbi:MAG: dephospho-CoA kinase [Acidobacteriota bacterium]